MPQFQQSQPASCQINAKHILSAAHALRNFQRPAILTIFADDNTQNHPLPSGLKVFPSVECSLLRRARPEPPANPPRTEAALAVYHARSIFGDVSTARSIKLQPPHKFCQNQFQHINLLILCITNTAAAYEGAPQAAIRASSPASCHRPQSRAYPSSHPSRQPKRSSCIHSRASICRCQLRNRQFTASAPARSR